MGQCCEGNRQPGPGRVPTGSGYLAGKFLTRLVSDGGSGCSVGPLFFRTFCPQWRSDPLNRTWFNRTVQNWQSVCKRVEPAAVWDPALWVLLDSGSAGRCRILLLVLLQGSLVLIGSGTGRRHQAEAFPQVKTQNASLQNQEEPEFWWTDLRFRTDPLETLQILLVPRNFLLFGCTGFCWVCMRPEQNLWD